MSADKSFATLNTSRLDLLPVHEDLAARAADFFQRNAQHLAPWEPPQVPDFASEACQRV